MLEQGWNLSWLAVDHGDSPSLGYRVERDGRVLAISGDTQYCANLVELARDADLLVAECSSDDDHSVPGHMTPSQVAKAANEANVKRVVITHVYPPLEPSELAAQCGKLSGVRVEPGSDLNVYEV